MKHRFDGPWRFIPPKSAGAAESGAVAVNLPPGPFIMVVQHHEDEIPGDWTEALEWVNSKQYGLGIASAVLVDSVPERFLGAAAFANVDGKTTLVGYHWDTSD